MDADGMALLRAPAFDVSVHAQKESPYATASQNELARQLYQLGVFNPAFAQQAVPMLEMMQFPGRDKVLEAVRSSIVPPQPETPDAGTDTSADPLLRAQAEKPRHHSKRPLRAEGSTEYERTKHPHHAGAERTRST